MPFLGVYANCSKIQHFLYTPPRGRTAPPWWCIYKVLYFGQFAYTPRNGTHQQFSYFCLGPNPVVVYIYMVSPLYTPSATSYSETSKWLNPFEIGVGILTTDFRPSAIRNRNGNLRQLNDFLTPNFQKSESELRNPNLLTPNS